jgi:hypothetical protein
MVDTPGSRGAAPGRPGDVIVKVITGDIVAAVDDLVACRPRKD